MARGAMDLCLQRDKSHVASVKINQVNDDGEKTLIKAVQPKNSSPIRILDACRSSLEDGHPKHTTFACRIKERNALSCSALCSGTPVEAPACWYIKKEIVVVVCSTTPRLITLRH